MVCSVKDYNIITGRDSPINIVLNFRPLKGGGDQAICDFRVYDIGERTAQPPEIQNTQVWYQNKGMVILFRFQKKISF